MANTIPQHMARVVNVGLVMFIMSSAARGIPPEHFSWHPVPVILNSNVSDDLFYDSNSLRVSKANGTVSGWFFGFHRTAEDGRWVIDRKTGQTMDIVFYCRETAILTRESCYTDMESGKHRHCSAAFPKQNLSLGSDGYTVWRRACSLLNR